MPTRVLLILVVTLSSGCVSYWRGKEMTADITALKAQVDQITEDQRKSRERLDQSVAAVSDQISKLEQRLTNAIDQLRTGSADTGLVIEQLRRELNEANGKLAEVKQKLREGDVAPAIAVPAAGVGAVPLPTDAAELYRYGYDRKGAADCDEAVRAFATFLRQFPTNKFADNSLFLMADCQYEQKQYAQSIRSLQTILQKYARGDKVDDALILMHDNFVAMGRCKDAMPFLETLIADYPSSDLVGRAKSKLKSTQKSCR